MHRYLQDILWTRTNSNSLHGHSWEAKVTVQAKNTVEGRVALDMYDMVLDFGEFKALRKYVDDNWDHATMLYVHDPLVPILESYPGCQVVVVNQNPTSEAIAGYLAGHARSRFARFPNVQLASVTIRETCTSEAIWVRG